MYIYPVIVPAHTHHGVTDLKNCSNTMNKTDSIIANDVKIIIPIRKDIFPQQHVRLLGEIPFDTFESCDCDSSMLQTKVYKTVRNKENLQEFSSRFVSFIALF